MHYYLFTAHYFTIRHNLSLPPPPRPGRLNFRLTLIDSTSHVTQQPARRIWSTVTINSTSQIGQSSRLRINFPIYFRFAGLHPVPATDLPVLCYPFTTILHRAPSRCTERCTSASLRSGLMPRSPARPTRDPPATNASSDVNTDPFSISSLLIDSS